MLTIAPGRKISMPNLMLSKDNNLLFSILFLKRSFKEKMSKIKSKR
jgi:hypothetical protein